MLKSCSYILIAVGLVRAVPSLAQEHASFERLDLDSNATIYSAATMDACPVAMTAEPRPVRHLPTDDQFTPAEELDFKPDFGNSDFHILGAWGKTGQGTVYLVNDVGLDRWVAIKVSDRSMNQFAEANEDPSREGKEIGKYRHNHIARVHGKGTTLGPDGILYPYLVFEYIEGANLNQWGKENPKQWTRMAIIIRQIALALAALHSGDHIHRDLKSGNIVVGMDPESGNEHAYLIDFGLSGWKKVVKLCGSPEYMSPEQANCLEIDGRSDIWGLGAVLYSLIMGRPPNKSNSVTEALVRAVECRDKTAEIMASEAPDALKKIVLKAMACKREDRYQTARQMADDLENYMDSLGVPPPARRGISRRALVTAAVPALGLTSLAGLGVRWWWQRYIQNTYRTAEMRVWASEKEDGIWRSYPLSDVPTPLADGNWAISIDTVLADVWKKVDLFWIGSDGKIDGGPMTRTKLVSPGFIRYDFPEPTQSANPSELVTDANAHILNGPPGTDFVLMVAGKAGVRLPSKEEILSLVPDMSRLKTVSTDGVILQATSPSTVGYIPLLASNRSMGPRVKVGKRNDLTQLDMFMPIVDKLTLDGYLPILVSVPHGGVGAVTSTSLP